MNHLKIFESFKKEDFYTDITEEEYLERDDKVDFDNKYYSKLLDLFWVGKTEMSPGENYFLPLINYTGKSSIYGIECSARNSYPKSILITQHHFYVTGEVEDIMSGPFLEKKIIF
jgi:hypothetical protein